MVRFAVLALALVPVAASPPPLLGEEVSLVSSREQAEEFLRNAEVVERKMLPVGVTRSYKLRLADGDRETWAVWKTINEYESIKRFYDRGPPVIGFRDSYRGELAAYELDKLLDLGLVPPTVERRINRRTGSLQLWVEGCVTEAERRESGVKPPDRVAWDRQVYRYRLFHQLIQDFDYQNISNLLVEEETFRIWSIDHSRAFLTHGKLLDTDYLRRFSRALLERLRRLEKQELDDRLGRWLTRDQVKGLLERRDLIVARAEGLVAEKGEPAVLYD